MMARLNLTTVPPEIQTLVDLTTFRASDRPDKIAYRFLENGETLESTLTYAELDGRARAIASFLQDLQLYRKPVLLFYPSGLEYICAFLGCLYAGAIAVPASPPRRNQKRTWLQSIVNDCQAKAVLTHEAVWHKLQSHPSHQTAIEQLNLYGVMTDHVDPSTAHLWSRPDIKPEDIAFLQYTSGSTGEPKGVMVSHRNILQNSESIYRFFGHSSQSHALSWLPPYDNMGLIGNILQPLYGGFLGTLFPPVYFLRRPLQWLQAISRYGATTSGGPNFVYDLCVKKAKPEDLATLDLSHWTVAFNGAEPVRSQTLERFAETFAPCGFRPEAFYPCYGMAESTLMLTGGKPHLAPKTCHLDAAALERGKVIVQPHPIAGSRTLVSSGSPQSHGKVLIVNPKSGEFCPEGSVGEIWVAESSVAQGYWGRPEQTQEVFQAWVSGEKDGPFLRTGDLGFLWENELYVIGRLKDLIILQGQNHYPQNIELTAEQSHPSLAAGAGAAFSVTDVQGKDHLVIVQEVERALVQDLDCQSVIAAIAKAVAREYDLQVYAISLLKPGAVPKTSSGKICRRASRLAFLSGQLPIIYDWSENPRLKRQFQMLQSDVNQLLAQLSNIHAIKKAGKT
jgi:acyl-CoA synthetase (AMP-forming)/AMP-acid ligase II